jgi:hypothetical protein
MSSPQNPTTATPTIPTTPGTQYLLDPIDAPSDSPPAYDLVVDPRAPISNMGNNAYREDSSSSEYFERINLEDNDPNGPFYQDPVDDTPEFTINAATQIKGHQNIVSVSTLDVEQIAEMVGAVVKASQGSGHSSINITINCGTTIIGNRNIVGSGLGEVARHMQQAKSAGTFPNRATSAVAPPRDPVSPAPSALCSPDTPVTLNTDLRTQRVRFAVGTKRSASGDRDEEHEGKRTREE